MRLYIPEMRGNDYFFEAVRSQLAALPGVTELAVRPLTGSILLRGLVEPAELRDLARDRQLFALQSLEALNPRMDRRGTLLQAAVVLLALLGFGIYRGAALLS